MSKPSQIIILVEDNHQRQLIQRYLKERGHKQHELRFQSSPSGQGSAENWVRTNFAKQVSACRNRSRGRRAKTALIVMIDADTISVHGRLAQLDVALEESGKPAIDSGSDQIARLIPKRNVETWVLCLNENAVDEMTGYKTQGGLNWNELISSAAKTLAHWRSEHLVPDFCTESLRHGLGELDSVGL